jgi:RNA polymerase sigma factor (sigma-70 family)
MDNGASSYHRFLEGDREGITELVDVYYDGLVLFLNTWLNNLHDAEDMAEETFVVLTTRKPEFTGQSSFKTWLYAIGRNVTGKFLRKNRRTVTVPPEDMTKLAESEQEAAGEQGTYPQWAMPEPTISDGFAKELSVQEIPMGFAIPHVAPDDPCPCGSGLRYCRCHGKYLS